MIYTLTPNPSIDLYMMLSGKLNEGINRTSSSYCALGGKGINVSMVLDNMNVDSTVLTFVGGFTGSFISEEIEKFEHINFVGVKTDSINRINVKVRANVETDINSNNFHVGEVQKQEMLSKIEEINPGDVLLICGRLAEGLGKEFLLEASRIVKERNAKIVLDSTDLTFDDFNKCEIDLIKPNKHELLSIFNVSDGDVDELASKLLQTGVKSILLSLGEEGARYYSTDAVYDVTHPVGKAVNTTGAGDSMLAGFIGTLYQTDDVVEALKYGAAAGQATACSSGLATLEGMKEKYTNVCVSKRRIV